MPSPRKLLFSALIALVIAPAGFAQITSTSDPTQTPVAGAGHDYVRLLNETVSPEMGTVSVQIRVPVPTGRKLTLPFSFQYSSGGALFLGANWAQGWGATWTSTMAPLVSGGWSYALPSAGRAWKTYTIPPQPTSPDGSTTCSTTLGYVFTDVNGVQHDLNMAHVFDNYATTYNGNNYTVNYACQMSGFTQRETDTGGDSIVWSALNGATSSQSNRGPSDGLIIVADPDGTTYAFGGSFGGGPLYIPQASPNSETDPLGGFTDRNGNNVGVSYTTYPQGNPLEGAVSGFTMQDTIGRSAVTATNFAEGTSTVNVSGLSQPYTATWSTWNYSGYNVTAQNVTTLDSGCAGSSGHFPGYGGSESVITSLTLPNNQAYQFTYDPTYGTLKEIQYPSGGWVKYDWGLDSLSTALTTTSSNLYDPCVMYVDTAAVQHRYVSYDGQTTALQQDFSYSTQTGGATSWQSKTTIVTTHDLIRTTSFQTIYSYAPISVWCGPNGGGGNCSTVGVETSVAYKDTNGNLLETVYKGWYDQNLQACQLTVLPNGLISGVFYTYGPGGQVTDKKEYDYGIITSTSVCPAVGTPNPPAGPTRDTVTAYASFPNAPQVLDRPSSIVVQDSSGKVAETDFSYDSIGNALTKTNQCFLLPGGQACPQGNTTTTYSYDSHGQITSTTDSNHNTTQFSYADSYGSCGGSPPPNNPSDAYLTQITYPPTNGVQHIVKFCYGYDDGQLRGTSDENNQTTVYKYDGDLLDRLKEIDYPDGGQTLLSYDDTPRHPSVTTEKLISSGIYLTTIETMDGAGHPTQMQLIDPQGNDTTVTAYDGLGRVYKQYNPTRCGTPFANCGESTWGFTMYSYDPLGRIQLLTRQDGSTVSTSYAGNCTTVRDEAGKSRESCTDGLGRMTQVFEDPSGLNWETDYSYDALDDLTSVVQGGSRNRTFNYDSLRHLTRSVNPESGIINYAYDANGNLVSKAAPAPNQVGTQTVTTSYAYDALNRALGVTYSNGDPAVTYGYDQSICLGQLACFNIGHRTSVSDAGGTEYYAYDPMGREIADRRITNAIPRDTIYDYDKAGDLTTLIYPSGRILNYTFDSAGRASDVQDAQSGTFYATGPCPNGAASGVVNGVCYAPQGAISEIQKGTNLLTTRIYNSRLQPCWIYSTTSNIAMPTNTSCSGSDPGPGNVLDLQYCFYSWVSGACQATTTNNGNVIAIANNRDNTRSQSFTYDAVNRLIAGQTSSTSGANCWGETYTYDQWANLKDIGWVSGYTGCRQEYLAVSPNSNNQLSQYSYDAAGNMLTDGTNGYIWNAENEITSVAGVNYTYDGDGNRVAKSNGKLYWYGLSGEILEESTGTGTITDEYIFFDGKRIAHIGIN